MDKKHKGLLSRRVLENMVVVAFGILFYVSLSNLDVVTAYVSSFFRILRPFVIGFAMAYLLNRPVRFFETKVFYRLRRGRTLSILTTYLLALLLLAALLGLVVPQVAESVVALVNNASGYMSNLSTFILALQDKFDLRQETIEPFLLTSTDLVERVTKLLTDYLPRVLDFSMALGSSLVSGITAVISSVYMLSGKNTLIRQFRKLVYALAPREKAAHFMGICAHANDVFSGFIIGKLLDSAIIGVICFFGMNLLGMPYALLISTVIGVTNVIPFFGPFIGAIPSVLILLIIDPWSAVKFGIFVVALQQFDGNILGPKILGDSTGLSAIWVLVAIIVGGGLFGFAGMILGVPSFAVLYALTSEFLAWRLREKGIDGSGNPAADPADDPSEEACP